MGYLINSRFRADARPGQQVDPRAGQAMVEYLLMMLTVVSVVSIMGFGFRRSLFALWQGFSREISAACPGCPPKPNVKIR